MKSLTIHKMIKLKTIVTIIFISCSFSSFSQTLNWVVTSEQSAKANPLKIEPKNIALGRNIFKRTCVACHGEKADGKGLILSANLVDEKFTKQSDGAAFFKISSGRDKMPPFSAMLKEDEIWSVINYLRVLVDPSSIPPPKNVKLIVSTGEEIKSITATIMSADSTHEPLQEVDVHFYVKRDFGLMRIGELSNFTGADGKIKIIFPEKIIGNYEGNVEILVKVENNFLFNDFESSVTKKWGKPMVTEEDQFTRRALWGSRDKSPIWLLLLANGIIALVWAVIAYVVYNIFRIKKAGRIFLK
jgi:mono/diheme cytochrome c family protein